MKLFFLILLLLMTPLSQGWAQSVTAPPVDEATEDPTFEAYRSALLEAVVARDIDAILEFAAPDIELRFGEETGHAALRAFLEVDPTSFAAERRHQAPALRERNWADLETVLRMGGVFDTDGQFIAPYTYSVSPPEDVAPFDVMIVTGSGVALRERPIRYGAVVGRLEYDVVTQLNWVSGTSYVEVERADGTKGFVHNDYLRALVDYRAVFAKNDDVWKLTTFVAGE